MSLLSIKDLSITFDIGRHTVEAVKNVSLDIRKGEMVALVGESGSGKSVTAHSIMQLLPSSANILSGDIQFDNQALLHKPESAIRALRGTRISMIFQEPMSALNPLHTIGKQIAEVITIHNSYSRVKQKNRINELLEMVGLEKFKNRLNAYPHQLSGGERQRVMIAMAMANQPDLLIADEPTTALDVTLQQQILSLLKELQVSQHMGILLITHDLTIVKRLADHVAIMRRGEIVEQGRIDSVFTAPKHDYTKILLSSEPKGSALPTPEDSKTVITTDKLKVHFPIKRGLLGRTVDYVKAVDGISLDLKSGQTIGIVGESGSGKTTLGLALLRLIKSDGPIVFLGHPIHIMHQYNLRHLRNEMQIVFQDPFASLNPRMSIGDIIAEGLEVHQPKQSKAERQARVASILEQVGLEKEMMPRYPHEFSGGQRQRINIARAMILKPKLVLLDEPTSALDLTVQSQIIDLLKQFQASDNLAYLFISHDLRVVKAISHKVIVMRHGKVVEQNDTYELFVNPHHEYTKMLIHAAFGD